MYTEKNKHVFKYNLFDSGFAFDLNTTTHKLNNEVIHFKPSQQHKTHRR